MDDDHEQLVEELEAVEAIYPDLLSKKQEDGSIIVVKVPQHEYMTLQISFPTHYPSEEAPNVIEIGVCTSLAKRDLYDTKYLQHLFQEVMDSVFHRGSVCLFDFLTELDGVLYVEPEEETEPVQQSDIPTDPFEGWTASDPITDRGSTFMAFAAHVTSEEQAFAMLDLLKTDSKMRKANHVMSAWRIKQDGSAATYQDSDDDGETAAGSRMLHLITIMDVWNVIVVVARWFGGAHIGPDRFKHINSTAREAVVRAGFDS
ncbi:AIS_collapsed_G0006020.mRNA.1.CDS.1 [Saccharomyces cerevisiae]|nr:AIS_collapsed_G0006020.mRNA.1.CDS.1 [Saccharomyces cerevisiae]